MSQFSPKLYASLQEYQNCLLWTKSTCYSVANSFVRIKVTERNPQTSNGIFFQLRQLDYFCLDTTDITSFLEWFDIRCRWMLCCYFINIENIGYGVDPRLFPQKHYWWWYFWTKIDGNHAQNEAACNSDRQWLAFTWSVV